LYLVLLHDTGRTAEEVVRVRQDMIPLHWEGGVKRF